MHEFSLCQNLIEIALEEVAALPENHGAVRAVTVAAGALHQLVPETLKLAFEVLTRGTILAGAELRVRTVPVRVRCRTCGAENEIPPAEFLCPNCGSTALDLLAGREIYLETLEIDEP